MEPDHAASSIRHRDAAASGLTPRQLRSRTWTHPAAGVALARRHAHDLTSACVAIQRVLPAHAVWTHLTAAQLRGWWLPSLPCTLPLIVSSDVDAPHHDRRGVYVRRCDVPEGHRTVLDGARVASAAWTIAELAEDLCLVDLVVVIDCALHRGDCTVPDLWSVAVPGRRGVRTLRQAIRLADARSESAWETILRLLHVLCDITDVEPQYVVRDARGTFVARADLRIGRSRRLHEYDGGVHRDRDQHQRDLDREKRLARAGWERRGYTAVEVLRHPEQVVIDAEQVLGIMHDPAGLASWRAEVSRSSLTSDGAARLARRLRRFDRRTSRRAAQTVRRPAQTRRSTGQ
ncbi:MAG: hypothetical protein Q7T56_03845 [Nocardioidaceae bacterium]|nr:hypothetical protein [Nocardioidaceae bacterium]